MQQRSLGRGGPAVSAVGLGCNNFGGRIDKARTSSVIDAAIAAGITLFDTADIYGGDGASESLIGDLLGSRRDAVVLATKFGGDMGDGATDPRASRAYINRAIDASLARLRTDRIDLYQLHFPDEVTAFEETLAALNDLVVAGKVRYIGSSNFTGTQINQAEQVASSAGTARYVSAQNHYNLLHRDAESDVLPACEAAGVGVLPYYPLASGLLTGKYRRGTAAPAGTRLAARDDVLRDADFDTIERLEAFAADRGRTILDVAIAGLLAKPVISSVIAGATRPEQIEANVRAADWTLSEDDVTALDAILNRVPA